MKQKGVVLQRVRLVKTPLTIYTKYELAMHMQSRMHGDNIRAIMHDVCEQLRINETDFWLIDNKTVLVMNYTKKGVFLGFDVEQNAGNYLQKKNLLWQHAIPLEQVHKKKPILLKSRLVSRL